MGYVWANAKYPTPYVGVYLRSGEYSPVADGDSISGEFSVQSGAELTEAAGAKRAALRPNGPRSAPGKSVRIHELKSKLSGS